MTCLNINTMTKLKIAIQKSGRLHDDSLRLLKDCGIGVDNHKGQLKAQAYNFPMEILYLRNSDIPKYLEDGVVDVAIVGENLLVEKGENVQVIQKLGFSKCKVSIAIPKEQIMEDVSWLQGKKIATSYPKTLQKHLDEWGIQADIHLISGSVEITPNIGLADAICDIVSTGSTLFKNGLKEAKVLFKSEAVLTKSPVISDEAGVILKQFSFRLNAVLKSRKTKYVLMNVPNDKIKAVSDILPVLKSPTVLPLAEPGWSSLHSVIEENQFWEVIEELKAAGAEGILVVPVEKMIL